MKNWGVVLACKIVPNYLPGGTEETHRKPQDRYLWASLWSWWTLNIRGTLEVELKLTFASSV